MNSPGPEETILDAALARPRAERPAFVVQACGGDQRLLSLVQALLLAHDRAAVASIAAPIPPALRVTPSVGESPGDRIGHYKLLQKIGEGGCGVVYMAEQEEPVRRRVALKVIKLGMDTRQVIARFEAERQALAIMDHPNIAKVLDAGATENGRPYFVMELVRGIKVTEYCDQNNLPTEKRLDLFIQICKAIQHAHQKGIIHRDIKPSNILVTLHDGIAVPKVIDFGIAKAIEQRLTDKTLFTALEQFVGTPAYMSPEQAEMSGLDIDTRSDIYSLGVLLYELLTGKVPFEAKDLAAAGLEAMRQIIRERDPVPPSTRISTLDAAEQTTIARRRQVEPPKLIHIVRGDLDWIVMKCLEKDRTRRYETTNGLARDIERFLSNEPVAARPPGNYYRFRKLVRRNKAAFVASAAIVFSLALGFGVSTFLFIKERATRRQVVSEAGKSEEVARFLQDMLQGVGPSVAQGRDITLLKEILDQTAKRVGAELGNQPEVQAKLRNTIGQVYYALGLYQQAAQMHSEAARLLRMLPHHEHELATTLDYLAHSVLDLGKLDEAEKLETESLALLRKVLGNMNAEVAVGLNNTAMLLHHRGRFREAEQMHREALEIERKLLGNEHPEVATSLENLGVVIYSQGRGAEAEPLMREALNIRRRSLSEQAPETAHSMDTLGAILWDLGKAQESEQMHRDALALRQKLFGPENPEVAKSLNNLAAVLTEQGKLAEAESTYRQTLAMRRKLLEKNNPDLAITMKALASVCRRQNNLAETEQLLLEAIAIETTVFGSNSLAVAWSTDALASLRSAQGRWAEAETLARQSLAVRRKMLPPTHPDLLVCLDTLAVALRGSGNLAESETLFREALASTTKRFGEEHRRVAGALENLAETLRLKGELAETERLLRASLAIREKKTPDDWRTFHCRGLLGAVLLQQDRFSGAEPLLLSSDEGLNQRKEKMIPADRIHLAESGTRLVRLYEAMAQPEKAKEWQDKVNRLAEERQQ